MIRPLWNLDNKPILPSVSAFRSELPTKHFSLDMKCHPRVIVGSGKVLQTVEDGGSAQLEEGRRWGRFWERILTLKLILLLSLLPLYHEVNRSVLAMFSIPYSTQMREATQSRTEPSESERQINSFQLITDSNRSNLLIYQFFFEHSRDGGLVPPVLPKKAQLPTCCWILLYHPLTNLAK